MVMIGIVFMFMFIHVPFDWNGMEWNARITNTDWRENHCVAVFTRPLSMLIASPHSHHITSRKTGSAHLGSRAMFIALMSWCSVIQN